MTNDQCNYIHINTAQVAINKINANKMTCASEISHQALQLIMILCGLSALIGASAAAPGRLELWPLPESDVSVCLTTGSISTEVGGRVGGGGWKVLPLCRMSDEAAEFSYDGSLESGCERLIDR